MRIIDLLQSTKFMKALEKDLFSEKIAKWAVSDLVSQIPRTKLKWEDLVANAKVRHDLRSWLMILPDSHPIAGIYPAVVGAKAGLDLYIRSPNERHESSANIFLRWLSRQTSGRVRVLPNSFRVGKQPLPQDLQAIFSFSSNETAKELKLLTSLPQVAYEDVLSVSIVDIGDLKENLTTVANDLIRDAFSLAQGGCMSTRCIFICGEIDHSVIDSLEMQLRKIGEKILRGCLDETTQVAIDHDIPIWLRHKAHVKVRSSIDEPLIPVTYNRIDQDAPLFSERRFVIPLHAWGQNFNGILNIFSNYKYNIRYLSVSKSLFSRVSDSIKNRYYRITPLGKLGAPPWDGSHEGQPLFSITNPKNQ